MKCSVFDTYVNKKDGSLMHFDIIVPENTDYQQVINYGKDYLAQKMQVGQALNAKNCVFCHIEFASEIIIENINQKGYYILEMEGCRDN
jgi:hypothetical protein